MGRTPRAGRWIGALALVGAVGCKVSHPTSHATPLATVLTFQTAFAHDDRPGEYASLATPVRRDVALDEYDLLRPRLLAPLGWPGRMLLARNSLEDNLVGASRDGERAHLTFSLLGRRFDVDLLRESTLGIQPGDDGDVVPCAPRSARADGAWWILETDVAPAAARRIEAHGLRSVRLDPAWRILGLGPGTDAETCDPSWARHAASSPMRRTLPPDAWTLGPASLGVHLLTLRLPPPPETEPGAVHWESFSSSSGTMETGF